MKTPFASNKYRVTSPFGQRTLNGETGFHGGLDLVSMGSYDVVTVAPGQVIVSQIVEDKANRTWEWGNYVCVYGADKRFYYYCHMASRAVKVGQVVEAGDKLGVMGNTGYSFGAHLHFEVREADGTTKVNAAEVLGIPNVIGVYTVPVQTVETLKPDKYEEALDKLVSAGVINTPDYWRIHKNDILYIDLLVLNIAEKISGKTVPQKKSISTEKAIKHLALKGVINTPEYWLNNVKNVMYLDFLFQRAALALGGVT